MIGRRRSARSGSEHQKEVHFHWWGWKNINKLLSINSRTLGAAFSSKSLLVCYQRKSNFVRCANLALYALVAIIRSGNLLKWICSTTVSFSFVFHLISLKRMFLLTTSNCIVGKIIDRLLPFYHGQISCRTLLNVIHTNHSILFKSFTNHIHCVPANKRETKGNISISWTTQNHCSLLQH